MANNKDTENLQELKNMRFIATALLIGMSFTFVVSKYFENLHWGIRLIVAFSEAAMVGALADWFAVVALFRHPLGQSWIPRTAIIQKNKNKIGDGFSKFVIDNFLEEKVIMQKLSGFDLVKELTVFIQSNKDSIAETIISNLLEFVKTDNKHNEFTLILQSEITQLVQKSNPAAILANILSLLTTSGKHEVIVAEIITQLYGTVLTNRENIIEAIRKNSGSLVKMFSSKGVDSLLEIISSLDADEENKIKTSFYHFVNDYLENMIVNLKGSNEAQQKVNKLKDDLFSSVMIKDYVGNLSEQLRDILILYSVKNSDELKSKIVDFIDNVLIKKIMESDGLKNKLNHWLIYNLGESISIYKKEVGSLISDTISSWDGIEVSEKIELQVGKDLQFIRINGTLIGGLVGVLLFVLSFLIRWIH